MSIVADEARFQYIGSTLADSALHEVCSFHMPIITLMYCEHHGKEVKISVEHEFRGEPQKCHISALSRNKSFIVPCNYSMIDGNEAINGVRHDYFNE